MITCSHCGQILPDNTKFCAGCGAPVTPEAQQLPEQNVSVQNPYAAPYQLQNPYAQQIDDIQQTYNRPYQQSYTQGQQNYGNMQQNYFYPQQTPHSNGKSIAALVLGILSILLLCTIALGNALYCCISIPFGILGIIFACIARKEIKRANPTGNTSTATAGLICSMIGLTLSVLMFLIIICMAIGLVALDLYDI